LDLDEERLQRGRTPVPAGAFELVTEAVHAPRRLQRQRLVVRVGGALAVAHGVPSSSQTLPIRRNLRAAVGTDQPSLPATSSLVSPSIFQTATRRSASSPRAPSRRRYSSAAWAANCGSGSWLINSASDCPSPSAPARPRTRPPPR